MKTFRFIGMALLAIVMCVNFASCSDDEEEQGETYIVSIYNRLLLNIL